MPQAKSLQRLATYLFLAMFPLAVIGFWPTYVTKLSSTGLMLHPEWVKWVALVVQVELVGTALIGWCPLYWSFGTHSCSMR